MISRCIPIRWEDAVVRDIDATARQLGLTRSGFVKFSVALHLKAADSGLFGPQNIERLMLRLLKELRGSDANMRALVQTGGRSKG